MSTQYDELSPGSPTDVLDHPAHNHSDMQQLAGDVVPLPMNPGGNAMKTGPAGPIAVRTNDSDKVISYPTFLSKKVPFKDK